MMKAKQMRVYVMGLIFSAMGVALTSSALFLAHFWQIYDKGMMIMEGGMFGVCLFALINNIRALKRKNGTV